ncbi:MAG: glycine cleavage system protein H [candidate division Zixibacteria bacterium]|nr:glycine cleavage system protein H [candidate division Zixibacteria bacterium]
MSEKQMKKSKLIPTSAKQCIWVDAGVISYRLCPLNYECERCSLHQALIDGPTLVPPCVSHSPKSEEKVPQRAEFEKFFSTLPASARKCHYMLTGEISYKLCINGFNCANCSFQQMMEDSAETETNLDTQIDDDSDLIEGFRFPQERHYHRGHTWIRVEHDGNVRVGIDDFGQWLLGSTHGVQLPNSGETVFEGARACDVRLDTGQVGLLAPVSGRVIATNERLLERPELVNQSPYTNGWLFMMEPFNLPSELMNLLYGQRAKKWAEQEIKRVGDKINGNGKQININKLEKNTTWRKGLIDEIASEFLLAKIRRVA